MRVIPILWERDPRTEDWRGLSNAREALGYGEKLMPANAVPGSPQPVLAIGTKPTWLTDYAYADSTAEAEEALGYCLDEEEHDTSELFASLLSDWMGTTVKYLRDEEQESGVRFT